MVGSCGSMIQDPCSVPGRRDPENDGTVEGSGNSQERLNKTQEVLSLHMGKTKKGTWLFSIHFRIHFQKGDMA